MVNIKNIDTVSFFHVNSKNELVTIENELNCCVYANLIKYKEYTSDLKLFNISINEQSKIWFNYLLENPIGFCSDIELNVFKYNFTIQFIREDFIYCFENRKGKKYNFLNQLIWEIEDRFFSYCFQKDTFFYLRNKNVIIAIDDKTGIKVWQYTLPEKEFDWHVWEPFGGPPIRKAEVRKMLGVHQNILWVVLNSGFLLGIDTEKGELVHTIDKINRFVGTALIYPQLPNEPQENWGRYFTKYVQLDSERGVLFGLKDSYYIEIDLNDPLNTYTVYDASETMQANQIEADMATIEWAWQGDEIFFGKNFSGGNNLGVFNRATKQVSWATRVLNEKGGVESFNKIEYAAGRLYALTQKTNTLYVFEKEHT